METTDQKPKKRRWRGCLIMPAVIIVLAVVGFVILIFVTEKKQENIVAERGRAETYSEIFNANFLPDYAVSAADEATFNQKMTALLQKYRSGTFNYSVNGDVSLLRQLTTDESIAAAQQTMAFLKNYYPEGYFLVVNQVLKTLDDQQIFPNFFLHADSESSRANFLVHETSHVGILSHPKCSGIGYAVEDKFMEVKKLDLPKNDELLPYVIEPASLDQTYLQEGKQDLYTTLDEVISYTKSVRVGRSFIRYQNGVIAESDPQALSRQLYYLSLHLKNLKENHAALWQEVKNDKNFVYIMSRVASMAKIELQAAKDEGVSGSVSTGFALSIDGNLALFEANKSLFDELYAAASLDTLGNLKNLTQPQLTALGVKIEKF